jgi:hypothetical protein
MSNASSPTSTVSSRSPRADSATSDHPLGHYQNCTLCGVDLKAYATEHYIDLSEQCGHCDGYWCPVCVEQHVDLLRNDSTICGCIVEGVWVNEAEWRADQLAEATNDAK